MSKYNSHIRHWECILREAFLNIPETELKILFKDIYHACRERNFTYEREGRYDVINLLPIPLVASREQIKYLHRACLIIKNALSRLIDLYIEHPTAREILPLSEEEEKWIKDTWTKDHK